MSNSQGKPPVTADNITPNQLLNLIIARIARLENEIAKLRQDMDHAFTWMTAHSEKETTNAHD